MKPRRGTQPCSSRRSCALRRADRIVTACSTTRTWLWIGGPAYLPRGISAWRFVFLRAYVASPDTARFACWLAGASSHTKDWSESRQNHPGLSKSGAENVSNIYFHLELPFLRCPTSVHSSLKSGLASDVMGLRLHAITEFQLCTRWAIALVRVSPNGGLHPTSRAHLGSRPKLPGPSTSSDEPAGLAPPLAAQFTLAREQPRDREHVEPHKVLWVIGAQSQPVLNRRDRFGSTAAVKEGHAKHEMT
jgi:hypothetical protein